MSRRFPCSVFVTVGGALRLRRPNVLRSDTSEPSEVSKVCYNSFRNSGSFSEHPRLGEVSYGRSRYGSPFNGKRRRLLSGGFVTNNFDTLVLAVTLESPHLDGHTLKLDFLHPSNSGRFGSPYRRGLEPPGWECGHSSPTVHTSVSSNNTSDL